MATKTSSDFKCDKWDLGFNSEKGLKIHIGKKERSRSLETPEKKISCLPQADISLNLSVI